MPMVTLKVQDCLKAAARRKDQSMEQEVRDLLSMRYALRSEITMCIRQALGVAPACL